MHACMIVQVFFYLEIHLRKAQRNFYPHRESVCSILEILVEGKRASVLVLFLRFVRVLLLRAGHDARFLIVAHALLEEIRLAGEGDGFHEVEGVGGAVVLLVAERDEEAVGHELDVLLHQRGVHAEEGAGQRVRQEFLLDGDGFRDHVLHGLLAGAVLEVREQQAGEVRVQTFVARDELVGKGEARHQSALLEPEDGCEGAAEEDALDRGEGDEALGEGGVLVLDPFDGPIGLLTDAGD